MCYHLNGVSITNEADWPRMAKFHAEWSDKICGVMLEYLLSDEEKRYNAIVSIFREWVKSRTETHLDMIRCNRTYTRFTTDGMSAILPDIHDAPSGWNTNNHYFMKSLIKTVRLHISSLQLAQRTSRMSLEQFVMTLINTILQRWVRKIGNGEYHLRQQLLTLMNSWIKQRCLRSWIYAGRRFLHLKLIWRKN